MILLFILFVSVRAECRNGGSLQDGICECVNGYYGNHCQVSPSTLCSYGDSVVNLDTHVIFNSEVKAKCTTPSDDCYATPWSLSVSNEDVTEHREIYTGTTTLDMSIPCDVTCPVHHTLLDKVCDLGCDMNTFCCQEHEQCSDRMCPSLFLPYTFNWTDPDYTEKGKLCEIGCDEDSDCAGDLICSTVNSKWDSVKGCMLSHDHSYSDGPYKICIDDTVDSGIVQETTSNATKKECQSDCNSDSDCEGDLRCFQRSIGEDVPGCLRSDTVSVNYDVCYDPNKNNVMRNVQWNTDKGNMKRCDHDCNSDDECAGILECHQRTNGELTPGCSGTIEDYNDICYYPLDENLPTLTTLRPKDKLGLCEGDCDNDDDCEGGLVCHQRSAGGYTPGCYTKDEIGDTDYCVDPEFVSQAGYIHGFVGQAKDDVYSTSVNFTDQQFLDTCCSFDELCTESNKSCFTDEHEIDNLCTGECSDGDFNGNGQSGAHTCCHPMSWNCDSVTCDYGFTKNSKYCGEKCKESDFATTIEVSEVQAIPMTYGSVICEGEEQVGVDSSGCFQACNSFTNYFVIDDKCFCANNLGGQCTNNITDCSDWCPSGIVTQTYSISSYFTTCEFSWDNCPAGWLATTTDWCRKQYESGTQLSSPDPCVASGTCCEITMYETYYISTDLTRTGSHCCDVDTSPNAFNTCMSRQCPDRYENKGNYATKLYSLDHTSECCDKIPDDNYCDTYNSGSDFACPADYRPSGEIQCDGQCNLNKCCTPNNHFCDTIPCPADYRPSGEIQCDEGCDQDKCCTPDNHFCDSFTCPADYIPSGEIQCDERCDQDNCCTPKPSCNTSHVCPAPNSHMIDSNYKCSEVTGEACAASEYEGSDKCCILKDTCAAAGARFTTSGCNEYDCDLCYETRGLNYEGEQNFGTSYVDTGGGNYQWVPNKYFDVQLDKAAFQENCCAPSCQQAKLELYDGGRGYKNGQPLCGPIDGGWNTWKGHSYGGSETDDNFMEPSWIVDNCCYPSCGTEAAKGDYSCGNFPIKSNYFSSDSIYGITLTDANFMETCCELPPPSCALSSLTESCDAGFIEHLSFDYDCWGTPENCAQGYHRSWMAPGEYWAKERSVEDFNTDCCRAPNCENFGQATYYHPEMEAGFESYLAANPNVQYALYLYGLGNYWMNNPADIPVEKVNGAWDVSVCLQMPDECRPFATQYKCEAGRRFENRLMYWQIVDEATFRLSCCRD